MDGQNRHRAIAGALPHVFAVSLFEDWVYWTDWNTHTVEKAHKYTGEQRTIMGNNTHRPYDIHVYHPYRQPKSMEISMCLKSWSPNRWKQTLYLFHFIFQVKTPARPIT